MDPTKGNGEFTSKQTATTPKEDKNENVANPVGTEQSNNNATMNEDLPIQMQLPKSPPLGLSKEAMMAMVAQQTRNNKSNTNKNTNKNSTAATLSPLPLPDSSPTMALSPISPLELPGESTSPAEGGSSLYPPPRPPPKNRPQPQQLFPAAVSGTGSNRFNLQKRGVSWGIDGSPPSLAKVMSAAMAGTSSDTATGGGDKTGGGGARSSIENVISSTQLTPRLQETPPPPPQLVTQAAAAAAATDTTAGSVVSKLSLQSILNASPYECEAEAYLQKSLDITDPTIPGTSQAQETILSSVPADAPPLAFGVTTTTTNTAPPSNGGGGWGKIRKTLPRHTRKATSTAENLFSLALDYDKVMDNHNTPRVGNLSSPNNYPTSKTSADVLAQAGSTLLRRHRGGDGIGDLSSPTQRGSVMATSDLEAGAAATATEEEHTSVMEKNSSDSEDIINNRNKDNYKDKGEGSGHGHSDHDLKVALKRANLTVKTGYKDFEQWLKYDKMGYWWYIKFILFYLIIPMTGVAAILFYFMDNPPCGTTRECYEALVDGNFTFSTEIDNNELLDGEQPPPKVTADSLRRTFDSTSYSFWLLFLVRQLVTFSLARLLEAILIDYLALRTKICVWLFGPFVTLFVVQSKGWPMISLIWAILDFLVLYGDGKFAQHWMYWQRTIRLFSLSNPGGTVTSSEDYRLILVILIVVSVMVAVKRFWLGIILGRQTFVRYADELADTMKKSLLVGRVSHLARDIEQRICSTSDISLDAGKYYDKDDSSKGHIALMDQGEEKEQEDEMKTQADDIYDLLRMSSENKVRIIELLGAFEDPNGLSNEKDANAPISAIIQFRASLSRLNTPFPFGNTFGPAGTREECVESIETVYRRLLLRNPKEPCLHFNTIAAIAIRHDGEMDEQLLKDLIKLFRPDRDGNLPLLDFAKSIDQCYKDLRLLRASVASHSRMDRAFEGIINVAFYFVLFCVVLGVMGLDPFVLFASVSGFVLGFAFMIGAACSKYFEGILLILVRHPYDVGDRIAISDVNSETSPTGSSGWIVKDVDLFTTTVIFGTTNEVATYSNGSLAASRIINAARSNKAMLSFLFKFPIDTPYKQIQLFRSALDKFIKARPREWISVAAFRSTRVEADLGFVEYKIGCQHRESWQQIGALLTSKADLSSFALELMKKMNMRYQTPHKPVDLTLMSDMGNFMTDMMTPKDPANYTFPPVGGVEGGGTRSRTGTSESIDMESVEALFKLS